MNVILSLQVGNISYVALPRASGSSQGSGALCRIRRPSHGPSCPRTWPHDHKICSSFPVSPCHCCILGFTSSTRYAKSKSHLVLWLPPFSDPVPSQCGHHHLSVCSFATAHQCPAMQPCLHPLLMHAAGRRWDAFSGG